MRSISLLAGVSDRLRTGFVDRPFATLFATGLLLSLTSWLSVAFGALAMPRAEIVGVYVELPFWVFVYIPDLLLRIMILLLLGPDAPIPPTPSPILSLLRGDSLPVVAVCNLIRIVWASLIYGLALRFCVSRQTIGKRWRLVCMAVAVGVALNWLHWWGEMRFAFFGTKADQLFKVIGDASVWLQELVLSPFGVSASGTVFRSHTDYVWFYDRTALVTLTSIIVAGLLIAGVPWIVRVIRHKVLGNSTKLVHRRHHPRRKLRIP